MKSLYLWPDHAALSLAVLWLASVVFLWAAREPMLASCCAAWDSSLPPAARASPARASRLRRSCAFARGPLCWPRESSRRRAG